jgi:hypothetical protein
LEAIKYFFSYSRQNSEFVKKLVTELRRAGVDVWLDQIDIAPGSRWDDSTQKALNESNGLVAILSPASVISENVMDEVSYAIGQGKKIVPIVIENCTVPFRLARYQHIDFTGNYNTAFEQLLRTLNDNQGAAAIDIPKSESAIKAQPNAKLAFNEKKSASEQKEASLIRLAIANISKITGIFFIVLAVIMTIINKCPTNVQYFIIYTLTGIGIALLLYNVERTMSSVPKYNVGILAGGVALPFILFFTNPIAFFKTDDCYLLVSATSATVFVHGKNGKQDMILRQKGFVILDVRGERKRASINENGQAFFQNLHVGDSIRLDIDFSEPYKPVNSDSVYVIQQNANIYLPVALQGIDKVKGMVLHDNAPLRSVTVKLEGKTGILLDTTDQTGDFSFTIPEHMQTKEYKVWFIKEGYQTKSVPSFPQTGEALIIVLEKR